MYKSIDSTECIKAIQFCIYILIITVEIYLCFYECFYKCFSVYTRDF